MNTAENANQGSGNWIAFLFGAAFNVLADADMVFLLDYALRALVGGFICLLFKLLGDVISPYLQQQPTRSRGIRRLWFWKRRPKN